MLAGQAAVAALLPVLLAQGVSQQMSRQRVLLLLAGTVAVGVFTWWLNRHWVQFIKRLVADAVFRLRVVAATSVLRMDIPQYDRVGAGSLLSRLTSDTEVFASVVVSAAQMGNQLLFVLLLLPVLVHIEWHMTLVTLALALGIFGVTRVVRRLARRAAAHANEATAELNARLHEAVSGMLVWRDFGQQDTMARRVGEAAERYRTSTVRRDLIVAATGPSLLALVALANAALVLAGGLATASGLLSLTSWYLFILALDRFWQPVANLSGLSSQVQAGLSALRRLLDLIAEQPTPGATPVTHHARSPSRSEDVDGWAKAKIDIELRQVSMWYSGRVRALDGLSLSVPAGRSLGMVGLTGAGKSTVLRLLARLYPYQSGEILVGGSPLPSIPEDDLRRAMAVVPQNPYLFSGSVVDNIRGEGAELSDGPIADLAAAVGGGGWLESLPDGLDTQVGERGRLLSAGQRQIVALLRAFARQPQVLLLDEPTAALDPASEQHVRELLGALLPDRTVIVVAHKLSTVVQLDQLAVLRAGRVVETGTHDDLLAGDGHYARFHREFFGLATSRSRAGLIHSGGNHERP